MKFLVWLIFISGSLQAMSKAPPPVAQNIAVQTFEYTDAKRGRPVIVELWYPTDEKGPVEENGDVWIHPKEIRNGPLAKISAKHPLIIMSHGHGGDRRYLSWLVETLIQSGFVVASVEHHGSSWRSYSPHGSLRFWERARDITFALNELFNHPALKERLDPKRIGFVGYSMGGMTGLALAGATAQNVKEIIKAQQAKYKEIEPEMLEQIDFSEAQTSFLEPRIKAMALLSPATFVFPPQSFKQIQVPIALVASEGDEVLPFREHAERLIKHSVPAKLKLLHKKMSHYVFLNRVSPVGKEKVQKELGPIQKDLPEVHREVSNFVAQFFKELL